MVHSERKVCLCGLGFGLKKEQQKGVKARRALRVFGGDDDGELMKRKEAKRLLCINH